MRTIDHPGRRDLQQFAARGLHLGQASRRYVQRTFTLPRVLVIGLTFCSLYFLYQRTSGASDPLRWSDAWPGLATFYLLFLQLRLVDDIADVDVDHHPRTPVRNLRRVRRSLWGGLLLATIVVALLNRDRLSLAVALSALACMLATYLGFKTKARGSEAQGGLRTLGGFLLSAAYEVAPFLMFLYVYFSWAALSNRSLSIPVPLVFTAVFWAGYEFWKYSRATSLKGDARGFAAAEPRVVLVAILCISFVSQLAAYWLARLPSSYPFYASALCLGFAVILWRSKSGSGGRDAANPWRARSGLLFVVALNLGLLVAAMLSMDRPIN
jgi:hypothetical protein